MSAHLIEQLITIPLFTGVIGYITNWTGILMLFEPQRFHGFRVPGLRTLYPLLPRRLRVIPAVTPDGRLGWQGIVPSRAEKMASIAVDKSLSKVGSIADFYRVLDPEYVVDHLTRTALPEVPGIVERIMMREHPRLWLALPDAIKDRLYARVADQLPTDIRRIVEEIGNDIDEYIDAKLMVIRHLSTHPIILKQIFYNIGHKELRFMQNFGFYFGYPMGFALVALVNVLPEWWVLPVGGVVIGYVVNYIGITMIFEPIHRSRWVPWRLGLFLKRRQEIADEYASVMADNVITIENMCTELLHGPRSDRTRATVDHAVRDSVDRAAGWARGMVTLSMGADSYGRLPELVGDEALSLVPATVADEGFAATQRERVRAFVAERMAVLQPEDLSELLRSAIKQDEWLLFLHGAVLGSLAGFLHLAIFGV